MTHLVILLDGWDWIQLSNIQKLVLKHTATNVKITTLKPASLTAALKALGIESEIVVVPEIVMTQGHLVPTWQDARIYAALAGAAWYFWRQGVLGTMVVGMAVYLPLHLGINTLAEQCSRFISECAGFPQ